MAFFAHMLMLSTQNIPRIRSFYEEGLGWQPVVPASALSIMYRVGASLMVFIDAAYQEKESGIGQGGGCKAICATFVDSKADVDIMVDRVVKAGGSITSSARERDLGLYSAYFADPEGNGWEVVYSPTMTKDSSGGLALRH